MPSHTSAENPQTLFAVIPAGPQLVTREASKQDLGSQTAVEGRRFPIAVNRKAETYKRTQKQNLRLLNVE